MTKNVFLEVSEREGAKHGLTFAQGDQGTRGLPDVHSPETDRSDGKI